MGSQLDNDEQLNGGDYSSTSGADNGTDHITDRISSEPASAENVLNAKDVRIFLGGKLILQGLTLSIKKGETFGLIGPNGAGKTTFIRILTGLLQAESGSIELLGKLLPDKSTLPRIGYMTQADAVYGDLSITENLIFFGKLFALRNKALSEAIERVINITVLDDHRDKLARNLSGGLRQRLSLAIALIHDPELLILDEPTVGIAPELRLAFWDHFRELNKKGVTILVTTHNLDEAAKSDRVGMIADGRVIAIGPVDDLLAAAGAKNMDEVYMHYRDEQ